MPDALIEYGQPQTLAQFYRMKLHTVAQFPVAHPAFTEAALRNLIFKAERRHSSNGEIPGNGLVEAGAIVRIGRKVLIDEDRFFDWVRQQNGCGT